MNTKNISEKNIQTFIKAALEEDEGTGDVTSLATISSDATGLAKCIVKENCIIAGIELADLIFAEVDSSLITEWNYSDGNNIAANTIIGTVKGKTRSILLAERLVLNCMQRMSGIATATNKLVQLVKPYGTKILDTRKTTPNFRVCEKWAVRIGGGINHRFGLDDAILIKDNHINAAGSIEQAINQCDSYIQSNKLNIPVIVEVRNLIELQIALASNIIDRILLDNFSPELMKEAVALVNKQKPLEASGGINVSNILSYAKTGIDFISLGMLTHHVQSIDISLKLN